MKNIFKKIIDKKNKEGIKALSIKVFQDFFCIFFSFLVVFLARLLSPIFLIRVGFVDLGRIGGIYHGDWYLCEKEDGKHQGRYVDIFFFKKTTVHVNSQWLKMWRQALPWVPGDKFWNYAILFNRQFSGFEKYEIELLHVYPLLKKWQKHIANPSLGMIEKNNKRLDSILKNNKHNISFSSQEDKIGSRLLSELNIPTDAHYICFHARDSAYLDRVSKNYDWGYHDYRDSSIENYLLAAEEMSDRGLYSIRMGAVVKNAIHSPNPKIIDYSTSKHRADFNDIYIGSHCRFFLCSDTGMSVIPEMFKVPVVYVNWTNILRISTWVLNGLFIFKKFYLRDEERNMTFPEIMNLDFGSVENEEIFDNLNLELIENTQEEIRSVSIEMDERINGTWKTTKKDEELQQRFWALFGPEKLKSSKLRIGADYLRKNKDLLN